LGIKFDNNSPNHLNETKFTVKVESNVLNPTDNIPFVHFNSKVLKQPCVEETNDSRWPNQLIPDSRAGKSEQR
jgi:hypothetical protein